MRAFSRLRQLSTWLARFPSMFFGALYLCAIPLFALFYHWIPFDFYDGIARYEPMLLQQRRDVEDDVAAHFMPNHPEIGNEILPRAIAPRLFTIQPFERGATITYSPILRPPMVYVHPVNVALVVSEPYASYIQPRRGFDELSEDDVAEVQVAARQLNGDEIDLTSLFPCSTFSPNTNTCLKMSIRSLTYLREFSGVERGSLTRQQNSFWRNMYFSAVTMSTLGYGDIVPLTNRSRVIVASQVILSPIIFALFLNSLTGRPTTNASKLPDAEVETGL